ISKAQDSSFTINGKLSKIKTGLMYLYIGNKLDSSKIENGKFSFKGFVQAPASAALDLKDDRADYFRFYIEPGKVSITGTGDSLALLSIAGSNINDDNKILKQRLESVSKWEDNVNKL